MASSVESAASRCWKSPRLSWAIILATGAACLWFWFNPALPGVAIAVLAAVVGIMTFREMKDTHKVLTTIAIFLLMGIELRDIRHDRENSDKDQKESRKTEDENFKSISGALLTAINGLDRTIKNTMPRAVMGMTDVQVIKRPIAAGDNVILNIFYGDSGNDTATEVTRMVRLYLGKSDDASTNALFVGSFNSEWRIKSNREGLHDASPSDPKSFFTFESKPLTEAEISALAKREKTIYVLLRMGWQDQTGQWGTDVCFAYQNFVSGDLALHPCSVGNKPRYALP